MKKIAIFIETKNGEIKRSVFGVITAAHGNDHELYGFLLDGSGVEHKAALESYGIHKVVDITGLLIIKIRSYAQFYYNLG